MAPAPPERGRETLPPPAPEQNDLFIDPMLGTPLAVYIQKDVEDRRTLVDLITKYGGTIAQSYSGVPYILVDPYKASGQGLYRQYAGKKTKIVLSAQWVHECIKLGALQTYQTNFAGCRVTGHEQVVRDVLSKSQPERDSQSQHSSPSNAPSNLEAGPSNATRPLPTDQEMTRMPTQPSFPSHLPAHLQQGVPQPDGIPPPATTFFHYTPPGIQPTSGGPPQSWQSASGVSSDAPSMHHLSPHMLPPRGPFREEWGTQYAGAVPPPIVAHPGPAYDDDGNIRDGSQSWNPEPQQMTFYSYDPQYGNVAPYPYMPATDPPPTADPPEQPAMDVERQEEEEEEEEEEERPRGRKRARSQVEPGHSAASLVVNKGQGHGRSPTPPARVIKSTYGGNLFTEDDIMYLKKYIDYCQAEGLVLSLREICERVAVKAPHHTFYSWRRYCNKHQIRLGGYAMVADQGGDEPAEPTTDAPGQGTMAIAKARLNQREHRSPPSRSPTPPRALFRSTTGKGVAFTDEDVTFLTRLLEWKKVSGKLDMVAFWKEISQKAPHHSRASWMKFYRRHKHELNHTAEDEPLPQAPEKKMRYSRADDLLLAKFFHTRPEGTSDKLFQGFARQHPHHPWKGWQEHHRIHKAKVDHLVRRLQAGENIDDDGDAEET